MPIPFGSSASNRTNRPAINPTIASNPATHQQDPPCDDHHRRAGMPLTHAELPLQYWVWAVKWWGARAGAPGGPGAAMAGRTNGADRRGASRADRPTWLVIARSTARATATCGWKTLELTSAGRSRHLGSHMSNQRHIRPRSEPEFRTLLRRARLSRAATLPT